MRSMGERSWGMDRKKCLYPSPLRSTLLASPAHITRSNPRIIVLQRYASPRAALGCRRARMHLWPRMSKK